MAKKTRKPDAIFWPGQSDWFFDDETPQLAVVTGNGYGKSTLCVRKHFRLCCLNYGCRYSIVGAPTSDIIETAILPLWEKFFQSIGYTQGTSIRSRGDYRITGGASPEIYINWQHPHTILLRTFHKSAVRGRVGVTCSHAWLDEAGLCPDEAFIELAKRTRDPRAKVLQKIYSGTPEGITRFAELFSGPDFTRIGRESLALGKRVLHGSTYDNPALPSEYIEQMEREFAWHPNLRRAYINGEFVPLYSFQGYDFDREHHTDDCPLAPNRPVYLSWDFNVGDGRVGGVSWVAMQEDANDLRVCDENRGSHRTTFEACDAVIRQIPASRFADTEFLVDGDASGWASTTSQFGNNYDIIRQKLLPYFPHLRVIAERGNPSQEFRITCVNRLFSDQYHEGRLLIDPHCTKVIDSAIKTAIKNGKIEKPSNDSWTHFMDAVGYAVCRLRPLKKPRISRGTEFAYV